VLRFEASLRRPSATQGGDETTGQDTEHAASVRARSEGFDQPIKLPSVHAGPPVTVGESNDTSPWRGMKTL
jgi:hypothetical protein